MTDDIFGGLVPKRKRGLGSHSTPCLGDDTSGEIQVLTPIRKLFIF